MYSVIMLQWYNVNFYRPKPTDCPSQIQTNGNYTIILVVVNVVGWCKLV